MGRLGHKYTTRTCGLTTRSLQWSRNVADADDAAKAQAWWKEQTVERTRLNKKEEKANFEKAEEFAHCIPQF